MSAIEYFRDLLTQFDGIQASDDITIDIAGMRPTQYALRTEPAQQVLRRYKGSAAVRMYAVALEGVCPTLSDAERMQNNARYEELARWLDMQTKSRKLPKMDGMRVLKVEATGGAYLARLDEDGDTGAYVMRIELTYYGDSL